MNVWDIIFNPLVTLMLFLYSVLGNNLIAGIVVLTVLIRMATYPLTITQIRSGKRTQELQPQLKKLQEKYKDDKEKLSQAQMAMYREAGVNPLGGCLPLIIQYPILIAMYQAIFYALASTPFQLVDLSQRLLITDLSRLLPLNNVWLGMDLTKPPTPPGNPIYALALPALVMLTTWIQFKVSSPTTQSTGTDQTAQMTKSMGTIMPVMFGFLSLSFSVGLSVYFIVSNTVGILQYTPQFRGFMDRVYPERRKIKPEGTPSTVTVAPSSVKNASLTSSSKAPTASKTPKTAGKSYGSKKK